MIQTHLILLKIIIMYSIQNYNYETNSISLIIIIIIITLIHFILFHYQY
jgi:hypothetical protein